MEYARCPHCNEELNRIEQIERKCASCGRVVDQSPVAEQGAIQPGQPDFAAPSPTTFRIDASVVALATPAAPQQFRAFARGMKSILLGLYAVIPAVGLFILDRSSASISCELPSILLAIISGFLLLNGLACCTRGPSRRIRFVARFLMIAIPGIGALYALFPESLTAHRPVHFLLGLIPVSGILMLAEGMVSRTSPDDPIRTRFDRCALLFACCYGLAFMSIIEKTAKAIDNIGIAVKVILGVVAFVAFFMMLNIGLSLGRHLAASNSEVAPSRDSSTVPPRPKTVPRPRPRQGHALILAGRLLSIPSLLIVVLGGVVFAIGDEIGRSYSWAIIIVGVLCGWAGGRCVALGRRMRTRALETAPDDDSRPIALFLRPFQFDGSLAPGRTTSTYEEHLARALGEVSLFVAIGRPGEPLPQLGANRIYIDDDHWQAEVQKLMNRATIVIMTVGSSEGLKWEIQEIVRAVSPQRLLLFVPPIPTRPGEPSVRRYLYDRYRRLADGILPMPLPDVIGEASFIFFATNWAPQVVQPPKVPLSLGFRRLRIEIANKIVQPYLECLLQDKLFLQDTGAGLGGAWIAAGAVVAISFYLVLEQGISALVALPITVAGVLAIYLAIMAIQKKL
jgi:hypothetical protein